MIRKIGKKANSILRKGSLISLSLMIMIIPQAALAASSLEMSGITRPEEMTLDAAKKGIVRIVAGTENEDGKFKKKAIASGFIVSDTGNEVRIVTTLHSVDFGEKSKVKIAVKDNTYVYASVESFPEKDFCILTAENKFNDKEMIPLRVSSPDYEDSRLTAGDEIVVLGFPESVGDSSDYTEADVSAQSGKIIKTAEENGGYIEHDAAVKDGCDGGVVTDADGYVIGLVNSKEGNAMDIKEVDTALYKEGAVYRSKDKDEMYAELYALCEGAEEQYKKADKETQSEISRVYGVAKIVLENGPYDRDALRSALDDYQGVVSNVKRSKKPLILIALLGAVIVYLTVKLVMLVKWNRQHRPGIAPAETGGSASGMPPAPQKAKGIKNERAGKLNTRNNRVSAARITVLRTGATYELSSRVTTLGKSPNADVSIPDNNKVSRDHAYIENAGGAYYLHDRGSTNGTYLNNMQVRGYGMRLAAGDIIRLADEEIRYY